MCLPNSNPLPCSCECKKDQSQMEAENLQKLTIYTNLLPKLTTSAHHKEGSTSTSSDDDNTNKAPLAKLAAETISIANIALPMILTGLLLYSRSMISMLFLGRLGELALAGGALALGFANITGYSILSGLSMGMEPICGQAFGAKKYTLLGLTMQRAVLLLLCTSLPITLLWLNMEKILLIFNQDPNIAREAQSYILYLTYCATLSILFHIPINYLLVSILGLEIKGIALAAVWTNANLVTSLVVYIYFSGAYQQTWSGLSKDCFKEWRPLLNLSIPSCISVCLEWWWYEIMILLCGFLLNPAATVASMGILIQTTSLIYIFPSSLSFAVSTRVGNELGANRPTKAMLAASTGISIGFLTGLAALLFATMVRNQWARLFTADPEIIALTSTVLPIIGLCELGNCPQTTGCGVLRGSARPRAGANINLGSFYLVGMPVALLAAFFLGYDFEGLWMGLMAAQGSCLILMLLVVGRTNWVAQAGRAEVLTGGAANDNAGDEKDDSLESDCLV